MPEPTGPGSREFLTAVLLPGAERSFAAADVEGSPAPWWMGCRWAGARAKPNAVMARPWCGHSMPGSGPPDGRWLVSVYCAAPINSGKSIGRACQRLRAAV
jgi:hypothetical protein